MKKIKIALIGFGTVGTGVAKILLNKKECVNEATGREVVLEKICDRDLQRVRDVTLPPGILTSDIDAVINDPEITIVIELMGGVEPARTILLRLLESGKDIVTANKALLAEHGPELFEKARTLGRSIAFEAAVCGGIPIISALSTALRSNRILSINAIVNGTSNYILSQMEGGKTQYPDAVKQAQKLGYAEANPAMDVDGTDAVQKLAILAQLGFGADVSWRDIHRIGIESIDLVDFLYTRELGYRIKLLVVAEQQEEGLELHVAPTLVKADNPLARVRDAFNAVRVIGDSIGPVFFHGYGAGQMPTASAVVSDVIDTILGRTAITFKTLNLWGAKRPTVLVKPQHQTYSRYYLRLCVTDQPCVLHDIAEIFSIHRISIASMIQHEAEKHATDSDNPEKNEMPPVISDAADLDDSVLLILTTHEAHEADLVVALRELEKLPVMKERIVWMRVQD